MRKVTLSIHVKKSENTEQFLEEFSSLEGKYGVNSSTSVEPFEDTSFIDTTLWLEDELEFAEFISELEELLADHGVEYVYKNN